MLKFIARDSARLAMTAFIAVALVTATFALKSAQQLPQVPLTEDGFYSLAVARNLALGNGFTTDSIIKQPTNGFQPLFTLITSLIYRITSDQLQALRLVLLLHSIIFIATSLSFAALSRNLIAVHKKKQRTFVFWCVALLYISSSLLRQQHHNGLETGFLLMIFALFSNAVISESSSLIQGLLLGALCLTRIDTIPYAIAFLGLSALISNKPMRQRFKHLSIIAIILSICVVPWLVYNYSLTGSAIPSSGRQSMLLDINEKRLNSAREALVNVVTPFTNIIHLDSRFPNILLGLKLLLLAIAASAVWSSKKKGLNFCSTTRLVLLVHIVFCLFIICWYTVNSNAVWFYSRYFIPVAPLSIIILSLGFSNILVSPSPLSAKRKVAMVLAIILLVASPIRSVYMNHFGKVGQLFGYRAQLKLVENNVLKGQLAAAFQSGTLGYFRNGILNLDGKTNYEVLALNNNKDWLLPYLAQKNIHWLCDIRGIVEANLTPSQATKWDAIAKSYSTSFKDYFVLYQRKE